MSRSPRPGVLAIDLGTSSVKALVVDQRGEIAGRGGATYPTHHPSPGYDEQEVDDWLDATITATSAARLFAPDIEIHAVSVTGQMHGTVLFDEHNQALGRAIVWSDRRAVDDLETLEQSLPADLRRRIGGPLATGYQIASLRWLRKHEQRVWSRIRKILLPGGCPAHDNPSRRWRLLRADLASDHRRRDRRPDPDIRPHRHLRVRRRPDRGPHPWLDHPSGRSRMAPPADNGRHAESGACRALSRDPADLP